MTARSARAPTSARPAPPRRRSPPRTVARRLRPLALAARLALGGDLRAQPVLALVVEDLLHLAPGRGDPAEVLGAALLVERRGPAIEQLGEALHDRQRRAEVVDQPGEALVGVGRPVDPVPAGHQRSSRVESSAISPRSSAIAIACTRLRACSLRMTLRTWVRTVSTDTLILSP